MPTVSLFQGPTTALDAPPGHTHVVITAAPGASFLRLDLALLHPESDACSWLAPHLGTWCFPGLLLTSLRLCHFQSEDGLALDAQGPSRGEAGHRRGWPPAGPPNGWPFLGTVRVGTESGSPTRAELLPFPG